MSYHVADLQLTLKRSEQRFANVMICRSRVDLDSALASARDGRQYVLLESPLSEEFLTWGRAYKDACGRFKVGKLTFGIGLLFMKPQTLATSGKKIYSAGTDTSTLAEAEPSFFRCLARDYYVLSDGRIFVDLTGSSLVGGALFMGKLPWPVHFKF